MKGGAKSPPGVGFTEVFWSWVGAMTDVGICS